MTSIMAKDNFMGLCLEIRNMIYEECLVVGKIFPYNHIAEVNDRRAGRDDYIGRRLQVTAHHQANQYDCPAVRLLLVNAAIHEEAKSIVYKRNIVVLPEATLMARFFDSALPHPEERAWLQRVEVRMTYADMGFDTKAKFIGEELAYMKKIMMCKPDKESPEKVFETTRLSYVSVHEDLGLSLVKIWQSKVSTLLDCVQLKHVHIDMEHCQCPLGCCFMPHKALSAFRAGFKSGLSEFSVVGLPTKAKEAIDLLKDWSQQAFQRRGDIVEENGEMEKGQISVDGFEFVPRIVINIRHI